MNKQRAKISAKASAAAAWRLQEQVEKVEPSGDEDLTQHELLPEAEMDWGTSEARPSRESVKALLE
jgi:hypothetical protein